MVIEIYRCANTNFSTIVTATVRVPMCLKLGVQTGFLLLVCETEISSYYLQEAKQAVALIPRWESIDVADALGLLSPVFQNEEVNGFFLNLLLPLFSYMPM